MRDDWNSGDFKHYHDDADALIAAYRAEVERLARFCDEYEHGKVVLESENAQLREVAERRKKACEVILGYAKQRGDEELIHWLTEAIGGDNA